MRRFALIVAGVALVATLWGLTPFPARAANAYLVNLPGDVGTPSITAACLVEIHSGLEGTGYGRRRLPSAGDRTANWVILRMCRALDRCNLGPILRRRPIEHSPAAMRRRDGEGVGGRLLERSYGGPEDVSSRVAARQEASERWQR